MARYIVSDLNGRSQAYFSSRGEARTGLREMVAESPGSLDDLYVVGYSSDDRRIFGPEGAADFLKAKKTVAITEHPWGSTLDAAATAPVKKATTDARPRRDRDLVLA